MKLLIELYQMSRIDNDFYWPISLKEFLNLGEEFNRGFFNFRFDYFWRSGDEIIIN